MDFVDASAWFAYFLPNDPEGDGDGGGFRGEIFHDGNTSCRKPPPSPSVLNLPVRRRIPAELVAEVPQPRLGVDH